MTRTLKAKRGGTSLRKWRCMISARVCVGILARLHRSEVADPRRGRVFWGYRHARSIRP